MAVTPLSEKAMVLDISQPLGGWLQISYVMWFPVTPGNELAIPGFVSAWKDIGGKDAALLTALQAGQVIERVCTTNFPSSFTAAQIEAFLMAAWNAVGGYLAGLPQPGQFYGTYWDGTVWSKA